MNYRIYIIICVCVCVCVYINKVTGAYENIYMAHSSWFVYASTHRIYKHYDFNVNDDATALKKLSFSSYPG